MTFVVRVSAAADEDLERLFNALLDRVEAIEGLDLARMAIEAVRSAAVTQFGMTRHTASARPARDGRGASQSSRSVPLGMWPSAKSQRI